MGKLLNYLPYEPVTKGLNLSVSEAKVFSKKLALFDAPNGEYHTRKHPYCTYGAQRRAAKRRRRAK